MMKKGRGDIKFIISVMLIVTSLTFFASVGGPSLFPEKFSAGSVTPGFKKGDRVKFKADCNSTFIGDVKTSYCIYHVLGMNNTKTVYEISNKPNETVLGHFYFKGKDLASIPQCGKKLDGKDPDQKNNTWIVDCSPNYGTYIRNETNPCLPGHVKNNKHNCTSTSQRWYRDDIVLKVNFYKSGFLNLLFKPGGKPKEKRYIKVPSSRIIKEVKPKPSIQPPTCSPIPASFGKVAGAFGCIGSYAGYVTSVLAMLPTQGPLGLLFFIPIIVGVMYILIKLGALLLSALPLT